MTAHKEGAPVTELQVEGTGETVGEAKWSALRELERQRPGLDKAAVRFQVVSEGERGLLGVGFTPARVIATVSGEAVAAEHPSVHDDSELAGEVRELVERIVDGIGVTARVELDDASRRLGQTVDPVERAAESTQRVAQDGGRDRRCAVRDRAECGEVALGGARHGDEALQHRRHEHGVRHPL